MGIEPFLSNTRSPNRWAVEVDQYSGLEKNTYGYELIRMVHHGDEEVEQHDHIYDGVGAEHEHAPEAREDLDAVQLERVQVYQPESRPEKRLHRLEQAAIYHSFVSGSVTVSSA